MDYLVQEKPDNVYILPYTKIFSDDEMEFVTSFTYTSYHISSGRLNYQDPSLDWEKIKNTLETVLPNIVTTPKPKLII